MELLFKRFTTEKGNRIHLKKKQDFIRDVNHFMMDNRLAYDSHFNKNRNTSSNPYHKIDALIWRYKNK